MSIREAYEGEGRPREALEAAADVWAAVIDYWSKKKNILVRLERQEGKRLEGKSERERERERACGNGCPLRIHVEKVYEHQHR